MFSSNETSEQKKPVVLNEKSDIKLQYNVNTVDVTIKDYSVYSTEGVKRDFYGYQLDEKENKDKKLTNAFKKGDYFQATKTWRFRNISDKTYSNGYLTPDPPINIKNNQEYEVAMEEQSDIGKQVKPKEEFEISTTIKIPSIPGIYKRKFRLNDENGRIISLNKGYNCLVIFRVVPHSILSPVQGNIESGNETNGRNTGNYQKSDTMYFCNWGLVYYDRTGKLKNSNIKPSHDTHRKKDRHAWDVNAKADSDYKKSVYSISDGKVKYVRKKFGLLRIHHDYIEGKESTTGYIAEYIHMLAESWSESSTSKNVWKTGVTVKKGSVLGKIGGRGNSSDRNFSNHLHFGFFPLHQNQKENSSVFAVIKKHNIEESKDKKSSANYDSQASYPKLVAGGSAKEWWIKFKNTGDIPWENHNKNNQVTKLALGTYSEPDIEEGQQFNCGWQSETRITSVEPEIVKPGEIGTFKFKLQAPEDISVEDSPFTLKVTPKTPDGWLRDDSGNELNCFSKITVTRNENVENANTMNQEVDDNYSEKEVNDSKIVCPDNNNNNSNDDNEQSIQNQKSNKDILKAAWVEKRCYHEDQVQVEIEFQDSVSDDETVKLSLYEYQNNESISLLKDVITANVKAFKMGIDITADFLDTCMTKGVENQFYFSCLVENGDTEPAKSDISYVDLPYVVSL